MRRHNSFHPFSGLCKHAMPSHTPINDSIFATRNLAFTETARPCDEGTSPLPHFLLAAAGGSASGSPPSPDPRAGFSGFTPCLVRYGASVSAAAVSARAYGFQLGGVK